MGEMKQRMLRGELYLADDPDIQADAARGHDLMERYNATRAAEQELRDRLLRELLGEVGEGVVVRPPVWIDYGSNISIGARTFVNYDCVLLDVAPIRIGEACQLATRVQLLTATHPIDPEPRRRGSMDVDLAPVLHVQREAQPRRRGVVTLAPQVPLRAREGTDQPLHSPRLIPLGAETGCSEALPCPDD